jgi:hypothetical protein
VEHVDDLNNTTGLFIWVCVTGSITNKGTVGLSKMIFKDDNTTIFIPSLRSFVSCMLTIQGLIFFTFFTKTSQLTKLRKHENTKLRPKSVECVIICVILNLELDFREVYQPIKQTDLCLCIKNLELFHPHL